MSSTRTTYAALTAVVLSAGCIALWALAGGLANAATSVTWSSMPGLPFRMHEGSGTAAGGRLYVFGGYDYAKIRDHDQYSPQATSTAFDTATNGWRSIAPLPTFAAGNGSATGPGVSHAGVATDGRYIYLAGGYPASADGTNQRFGSPTVVRYDTTTDSYSSLPNLPSARGAGALAIVDGWLHFMGGSNTARATVSEHWALNLSNTAAGWATRAPLLAPRNHLAAATVGGRIYVGGGQTGEDAAAVSSSRLESYDPSTNTWTKEQDLPLPLSHLAMTATGNKIAIFGGETAYNKTTASNYIFDPATGAWDSLSPLPASRSTGVAGDIGGILYYAGGTVSNAFYRGVPAGATVPTPGPTTQPTATPAATATPKPGTTPGPTATPAPGTTPKPATPTATPAASTQTAPLAPASTTAPAAPTTSNVPLDEPSTPGPAAKPRVQAEISPRIATTASRGYARFTTLLIAPATPGTTATITCRGGKAVGCPAGKAGSFKLRKDGKLTLRGPLVGRALRSGAIVDVTVSAPGAVGRTERYKVGKRGRVTVTVR